MAPHPREALCGRRPAIRHPNRPYETGLSMSMSVVLLLASFVLSLAGLFIFIASMTRGLFGTAEEGSRVIFAPDEENTSEEPAASPADQARLQAEMRSGAT